MKSDVGRKGCNIWLEEEREMGLGLGVGVGSSVKEVTTMFIIRWVLCSLNFL